MFSALEVVPLAMIGVEAYRNYQRSKAAPWVQAYKWSILSFIAVGFWNVVGAGLLGFSINTPIALYYMQGLNMTAAHGHAALFGVYGMLGIGLLLFCLRGLSERLAWSDRLLAPMFWSLISWLGHDGVYVTGARRHLPGLGQHHPRHVVCPLTRGDSLALYGNAGVAAGAGRHCVCHRHGVPGLVCAAPVLTGGKRKPVEALPVAGTKAA